MFIIPLKSLRRLRALSFKLPIFRPKSIAFQGKKTALDSGIKWRTQTLTIQNITQIILMRGVLES